MPRPLKLLSMLAGLALAALLAASWMLWHARMPDVRVGGSSASPIATLPEPRPLAEFMLRDERDDVFDLADLRGRWSFVFFGYTFCPDICPTTLVDFARVRRSLLEQGVDAAEIQVVFVSVDPARDTSAVIGPYVKHFDRDFRAATGSAAQLENLARQLGVSYRLEDSEGNPNYLVQHTAAVFLVDPQARFHGIASPPFDPAAIARRFLEVRGQFAASRP